MAQRDRGNEAVRALGRLERRGQGLRVGLRVRRDRVDGRGDLGIVEAALDDSDLDHRPRDDELRPVAGEDRGAVRVLARGAETGAGGVERRVDDGRLPAKGPVRLVVRAAPLELDLIVLVGELPDAGHVPLHLDGCPGFEVVALDLDHLGVERGAVEADDVLLEHLGDVVLGRVRGRGRGGVIARLERGQELLELLLGIGRSLAERQEGDQTADYEQRDDGDCPRPPRDPWGPDPIHALPIHRRRAALQIKVSGSHLTDASFVQENIPDLR